MKIDGKGEPMSDLINRQQAIDVLEEQLDYLFMLNKKDNPTAESKWYGINWARNTIAELPTAEPKVGRWIEKDGMWCDDTTFSCSVCGEEYELLEGTPIDVGMNYCPNCGARMERSE